MTSKTILFLSAVLFCLCKRAPPIDFFKEEVTIEITNGKARVTGIYFFENLTEIGKRVKFYYPFPVDSNHHYPDTISLSYPYERDSAGVFFTLSLRPKSVDSFRITYEQQIAESYFRYITTTTRVWKRPIKEANFTIVAPDTLVISMNYAFSTSKQMDGNRFYFIQIGDFFPEEDLIIRW